MMSGLATMAESEFACDAGFAQTDDFSPPDQWGTALFGGTVADATVYLREAHAYDP
jgi:hypothetical protein